MFNKYPFLPLCVLALVALVFPVAQAAESEPSIVVNGEGEAHLAPDMAVLTLTVTREGTTAREALDANSQAMKEVLRALRDRGIAERDLQTSNFNIQPRYTQPPRTSGGVRPAPRIDGYTVRNGLTVRVRNLDTLGEIIDQSVTLGVNEGGGVRFTNADPSAAIDKARVGAVKDALLKAGVLADAAGVGTGRILSISEQSYVSRPAPMMRTAAFAADAESVPMAAGESTYRVSVQVMVAIEQ